MSLTEIPDDVLQASLLQRMRRDPLAFFEPASTQQEAALRYHGNKFLLGGNRSGKTCAGAIEVIGRAIHRHPYLKNLKPAKRIWCCSQSLPGKSDKRKTGEPDSDHAQLETIRRWMPVEALWGQSWGLAYSLDSSVLHLANGCKLVFKSFDQDLLSFESHAVDFIWFDEEPPNKRIFTSCLLRLVDRAGAWMMTLTPVLSLEGKSGIAEELWENRQRGERDGQYKTFQLFTSDNVHLPTEEVAKLDKLPEEEKAVRLYGAFARLGGRVLVEFDPKRHVVPDFIPPKSWRWFCLTDPGWRTAAHLWAAVDPEGCVYLVDELYVHETPLPHRLSALAGMYRMYGEPPVDVVMDPAGFDLKRNTSGRESPSDAQEYMVEALKETGGKVLAPWYIPRPGNNSDPGAYRVKRYLAADKLKVCRGLKWWQWEQERWTRQRERTGPLATERAVPEKPIDRYNHLQDCLAQDTLIETDRGPRVIQSIRAGDRVLTRQGYRPVISAWRMGDCPVFLLEFRNGARLYATANHPVWVEGKGWTRVDCMRYDDTCLAYVSPEMASLIGATQTVSEGLIASTTAPPPGSDFTSRSGKRPTVPSLPGLTFIIKTRTRRTAPSLTWSALPAGITSGGISSGAVLMRSVLTLPALGRWLRRGIGARKEWRGTNSTHEIECRPSNPANSSANSAGRSSGRSLPGETVSVVRIVGRLIEGLRGRIWRRGPARTAGKPSRPTATVGPPVAAVPVVERHRMDAVLPVFNLQVADVPEFFANGILVHNCTRYLCNELPEPLPLPGKDLSPWEAHQQRLFRPEPERMPDD